jgi:RND family efflux transporter MFP subunit
VKRIGPSPPGLPARVRLLAAATLLATCGGNEYVEPPPPPVEVAKPEVRTVTEYLEFTGTAVAIEQVEIRARVKGFLQSQEFEEGDVVDPNQILFVIDPSEFRARVDSAKAMVAVRRAQLDLARATQKRMEKAGETRAVSELDVIEAQARTRVAAAELDAARAELADAQLDLDYTEIRSPIAGRVGKRLVDLGNLVGSGENTLLTTVVRYDPIYADFDLSERELLALRPELRKERGDVAEEDRVLEVRRVPLELGRATDEGYPYEGHLHYVDQAIDPKTGTYLLRGSFPNPAPTDILPGMFVRVRTPARQREGALLVSERAIGSDQQGTYVLVVDADDAVQYRAVEVGSALDGKRVIESGLKAEDRVIVEGVLRARPGAKVTPRPHGAPAVAAEPAPPAEDAPAED